ELHARLERMRVTTSPFGRPLTAEEGRQVRFVRPELVAEVEFRAWTADDHLRHAAFRGLREDKSAEEIIREVPSMAETGKATATAKATKAAKSSADTHQHGIKLTHPDRI